MEPPSSSVRAGDAVSERGLRAGEAARRLGVAVSTLRAWDRRYGIGPRVRTAGGHRRYGPEDLARLEAMCALVRTGVEASRAADRTREGLQVPPQREGRERDRSVQRRGLYRAALDLDAPEAERLLDDLRAARGVVAMWSDLAAPVLRRIGEQHARTGRYVEVEHLLSEVIGRVLGSVPRPAVAARVLLACTPDEEHSLPLEALAAALAERDVAVRLLGPRVPVTALQAGMARTGPEVVVLWAHAASTADPHALAAVSSARPRPSVIGVGGPGWDHVVEASRPRDLQAAVQLVLALGLGA